jgi:hypothetical protein
MGDWDSVKQSSRDRKELYEGNPDNTPRKRTVRQCMLYLILLARPKCDLSRVPLTAMAGPTANRVRPPSFARSEFETVSQ